MKKVRIFVDHANLDIAWRNKVPDRRLAWKKLPQLIMTKMEQASLVRPDQSELRGITVYASTHPIPDNHEQNRERWLKYVLDQLPGFTVKTSVRQRQPCDHGVHLEHFVEKGVDTMIVCDMLSLAMRDSYDVGVIISDDSDLVPSVQSVQDVLDRQIVHIGFRDSGQAIRSSAWAHLLLDDLKRDLLGNERGSAPARARPSGDPNSRPGGEASANLAGAKVTT